jgi:hypothetical protein
VEDAEALKVLILAHDYEPMVAGMAPDRAIGTTRQALVADMDANPDIDWRDPELAAPRDFHRRAAVAAQPAGMLTTRRSRSAANAKQARMSSLVNCGKSASICCSLIPEAR